ncbi:hypothetical protein J2S43_007536 [Catenuloplanes nepalensis]|uniref:Transcriptional regulator n=1 Tax=Catenuloplanes nepalensis TaxID=587533 RepID=A0ABT9N5S2_9ACTN|nr:hypothetical protein [Catenuloplanes nepalensis]MDP9799024.1 hypothetical protein [Catenuloplanes nepalensis]
MDDFTLPCPVADECDACGGDVELDVYEADTQVGVVCMTLCGACFDAGRTPRLSCPGAVKRALRHRGHLVDAGMALPEVA